MVVLWCFHVVIRWFFGVVNGAGSGFVWVLLSFVKFRGVSASVLHRFGVQFVCVRGVLWRFLLVFRWLWGFHVGIVWVFVILREYYRFWRCLV